MMNSTVYGSGQMGPAGSIPAVGISPLSIYAQIPACISDSGHRFAIGMYHKDRACCERCGLIRQAAK